jgi:hypothetical protein
MRITNRDRADLARFGCSFLSKQSLILIPWQLDLQKALSTPVQARFTHALWPSGPLLCIAFEIYRTKALAQYCFFPFDPNDKGHKKYLSIVLRERKIRLCLRTDSGQITRMHDLTPLQYARLAEVFQKPVNARKPPGAKKFDYDRAVSEFEQSVRLVDQFQYVLTNSELERVAASLNEEAAKVSPEDRAAATKIANDLIGAFRPHYESFVCKGIEKLPSVRRSFLLLLDLHRKSENDYEGFAQFVADAVAAHTPKENNRQLETATLLFQSLFRLIDDITASTRNEEVSSARLEADFRDLMARVVGGQGLSIKALTNLLSAVGVPMGGRPGRSPKDYSSEYDLKAAGQPWSAVAQHTLQNDAETRQEFESSKYSALTVAQRATLRNRVREGVRSYAKRLSKPFPPRQESKLLPAPRGEQKTSP